MSSVLDTTFSVMEWLTITGLVQSIFIIVYIVFRAESGRQASLALAYFTALALAFSFQFALRLEGYEDLLRSALWFCRTAGPVLCYLLVLQMAYNAMPPARSFGFLALVPIAFLLVTVLGPEAFFPWLNWSGAVIGSLALAALYLHRGLFAALRAAKGGRERYWLVMMLIVANTGALGIGLLRAAGELDDETADSLFTVLGLAFAYLASTALFRVYPLALPVSAQPRRFAAPSLTVEEREIAARIRKLMEVDKLYQEPAFSRAALAREVNVSENVLSRVINAAFGKSFPRLLSEFRVEDAKRLLGDPAIPVQVVATESGFNSLASFNRVFREITGQTPSEYRQSLPPAP